MISLIKLLKFKQVLFAPIKVHKKVRNLLGLGPTLRENTVKLMETVKIKNGKAQVKKSGTLLKVYYFSSTFQRILLGLKQIVLLFIKTGFKNTILPKINLYMQ